MSNKLKCIECKKNDVACNKEKLCDSCAKKKEVTKYFNWKYAL